ncbi:ESX secretion-associated protein EspG [Amycolatopsis suaedae]|uniref:ESX secretion-associated protein EspG n=1 Tax=Amycolatopsis suaedae TaxID=2510978 RepID=A0A4Q7J1H1_9PSEU|nr:ESX secretion-associated protein EspG [Amycolatopsis suaedae]RZQ60243.1 ESX secretion-associated protein EspG [Amycolatopsis suaedae]
MTHLFGFTLTTVEAAMAGRALGTDLRRFPLDPPALPADPARLAAVLRIVIDDLAARRLSVAGELNPHVRQAIRLFGSARVSVGLAGARFRLLGLTDGRDAVTVRQQGDELSFECYDDEDIVAVLVGELPAAPRCTGPAEVRVPVTPDRGAEHDDEFFGSSPVAAGGWTTARREPDSAALLLSGTHREAGFAAVDGVGRAGARVTGRRLSWVDTDHGRYLVEQAGNAVVYTAADQTGLARVLRAAVDDVQFAGVR